MEYRRFDDPITQGTVTILLDRSETDGAYNLLHVQLPPHAPRHPVHIHHGSSERFMVMRGQLHLRSRWRTIIAGPGDEVIVPKGVPHTYWTTENGCTFRCEQQVGEGGDPLLMMIIGSNLAKAGLADPHGIPKSIWHTHVLMRSGDTWIKGALGPFGRWMRWLADTPYGVETRKRLLQEYGQPRSRPAARRRALATA